MFEVTKVFEPYPYQAQALNALHEHICNKQSNPCVVIPTGGGKSLVIAWAIQRWKEQYPEFRVLILAHRQELVEQNSDELKGLNLSGNIGIYSAGLNRRDVDNSIIYASIDSIYEKTGMFEAVDCIIIDEAHRIPVTGRGKYRRLLKDFKEKNKNVKVVGFTATPFRTGCGMICHKDHILHEICFSVPVDELIRDGYLCLLRSKTALFQPDLTNVKKGANGDYQVKALGQVMDNPNLIRQTVNNFITICHKEKRRSIMVFCVNKQHCEDIKKELLLYNIQSSIITGSSKRNDRAKTIEDFKAGRIRYLLNINVYTEGFNAKRVDCVILLRPTQSKGLYLQMVGRGLRTHDSKEFCLVLDYANCIGTHGPIDCIEDEEVRVITCKECGDTFSRAVKICPNCGWNIPKKEVEREETEVRLKKMHDAKVSELAILAKQPVTYEVDEVTCHVHSKPDKPNSIMVIYRCGIGLYREWVLLDHKGFAEEQARKWWSARFGYQEAQSASVEHSCDLFLAGRIKAITKTITIQRQGKYNKIISHELISKDGLKC